MPLINTANFRLGYGTTKRSWLSRFEERYVTPLDFDGVGDGSADDTEPLQAMIDHCLGAYGDENGENPSTWPGSFNNKIMYIPHGLYKITAPLVVGASWGLMMFGAGSHQSRIFFDPESELVESSVHDDFYPVIEFLLCYHSHIEGITFDGSGVQSCVQHWGMHPLYGSPSSGTDGYYRDVHIRGAADGPNAGRGVMVTGNALGSERTWVKSKFTDCVTGYWFPGDNAINHFFYGCEFKRNTDYGMQQVGNGGSVSYIGCEGEDNGIMDYYNHCTMTSIKGCHSASQNFCAVSGIVTSNTHVHEDEGRFFISTDNPDTVITDGTAIQSAVLVGNRSANGTVTSSGGTGNYAANPPYSPGVFIEGNDFPLPDYYAPSITLANAKGSAYIWEDGVQVNPPTVGSWNPFDIMTGITGNGVVLSGGNLVVTFLWGTSTFSNSHALGNTAHVLTGKWYFEITVANVPSSHWAVGVANTTTYMGGFSIDDFAGKDDALGVTLSAVAGNVGNVFFNTGSTYTPTIDPTVSDGDVIGVAYDGVNRKVWFRHNGTWLRGVPADGASGDGCAMTGMLNGVFPYVSCRPSIGTGGANDGVFTLNLGATSFASSPPTGFIAWG